MLGLRARLNLTPSLSLDGSISATPVSTQPLGSGLALTSSTSSFTLPVFPDGSVAGGHAIELLMGPHISARSGRWAFGLGTEVGAISWGSAPAGIDLTSSSTGGAVTYGRDTFIAGQATAEAVYYLTPKLALRAEVGDEIINYGAARTLGATTVTPVANAWSNNAVFNTGVAFGFGGVLSRRSLESELRPTSHKFLNRTNILLIACSFAAGAADAITTQRFVQQGVIEGNLFAKPFADRGWPGQVTLAVLVGGAQTGIMYGLHALRLHRVERAVPITTAIGAAASAYHNAKDF